MAPLSILEEIGRLARSHQIPYHVMLELTYGCNLRCVMCYNPTHRAFDELTVAEYEALFDDLARCGTVQLTLTGGEVLARPDFWEIAQAARRRHFALRIFTNGTLVTPDVAARLADLVPLSIEISLYGATPETHDGVTARPGSFVRTLEGIRNLRAVGAPVAVKTLLTTLNRHEIDETMALIRALDVRFKGFDPVVFETHGGDASPLALRVPADEVARLLPVALVDSEELHCGDDEKMCGAANDFAAITPHGLVYPCLSMRLPMGNVRDRSFSEIWGDPADPLVADVRAATWGSLSSCSGCEARGGCDRCPGLAHHVDGDVLGPSTTHCDIAFERLAQASDAASVPS